MSTFEWEERNISCIQGEKAHRFHGRQEGRNSSVGIEFTHH